MKKPTRPKRPAASERGDKAPSLRPSRPQAPCPEATDKLAKVAGAQAVSALFQRDPQRVMRLYYDDSMIRVAGPLCARMAQMHRPYRLVDSDELARIAGTPLHGGIVAAALPHDIADLDEATLQRWARSGKPLVILDGVGNPHNLGAIARTLAFFGLSHLLLSDHPAQAGLSDAAYRVAEGGLEYLEIRRAPALPQWLKRLAQHYRVVGTALDRRATPLHRLTNGPRPVALIMGNEEVGLAKGTLAACESLVTIPGSGWVQSLNVSASAAILVYELAKPRTPEGSSRHPVARPPNPRRGQFRPD